MVGKPVLKLGWGNKEFIQNFDGQTCSETWMGRQGIHTEFWWANLF
jgi:hypothetical protein